MSLHCLLEVDVSRVPHSLTRLEPVVYGWNLQWRFRSREERGLVAEYALEGREAGGVLPEGVLCILSHCLKKKNNADINCLNNCRPSLKNTWKSCPITDTSFLKFNPYTWTFSVRFCYPPQYWNYLLFSVDSGDNAVLVLLDRSAAFDTVDHNILRSRFEHWVGIKCTALCWFESYLKSRSISVSAGDFISLSASLLYGVPQGSIALSFVYASSYGNMVISYGNKISFHFYADDSQLYLPLKSWDAMLPLIDCFEELKCWMSNNFLQLNNDKTEVILFGPSKTRNYVAGNLENLTPYVKSHVKNLGVIFDSELCFEEQMSSVVKNSYYQLRIISDLNHHFLFKIWK